MRFCCMCRSGRLLLECEVVPKHGPCFLLAISFRLCSFLFLLLSFAGLSEPIDV